MKKYLLALAFLVIGVSILQAEVAKPLPVSKVKYTSTIVYQNAAIELNFSSLPYIIEIAHVEFRWAPAIVEDYMLIYRLEYMEGGVTHWSDYTIAFMRSGVRYYAEYDANYLPPGIAKRPTGNIQVIAFGPN